MALARRLFFVVQAFVFLLEAGCRAEPQRTATQTSIAPAAASSPQNPLGAEAAPPANATGGFDGQKAFAHVERLVAIGPRPAGSDEIRKAQEYLRAQLRSSGCAVEEDDFRASTIFGSLPMKNIVAKSPGRSPSVVLLATHYDTKRMENFVGADDGGSSSGVMLELTRLLCGRKNALTIWITFFDGEESIGEWSATDGTFGSRQMAAKLATSGELKRVKAMLLADLVGGRNLRFKRESNSTRWLTDLVWSTAARLGYENVFVPAETAIEDDHTPFLRRNVPAVDIINLEAPYWHTPRDTLDKISPRSLAIVGHVLLETLAELEKKLR